MGYLLQMAGYTLVIVALIIGGVAIATQTSLGLALVFLAIGIPAIFLGRTSPAKHLRMDLSMIPTILTPLRRDE